MVETHQPALVQLPLVDGHRIKSGVTGGRDRSPHVVGGASALSRETKEECKQGSH
jgi:hypothetical protein